MFIDAKTSKWDSCAGEAIIKAMGGFSIKPNMEAIIYDPNEGYANNEGFIASLSQNVFNEIQDYISTKEFQNFTNLGPKEVEVKEN
jgi:3'-phosphoadenosine 5'-phosphosulfate (PAPS) 3'-phosphatase